MDRAMDGVSLQNTYNNKCHRKRQVNQLVEVARSTDGSWGRNVLIRRLDRQVQRQISTNEKNGGPGQWHCIYLSIVGCKPLLTEVTECLCGRLCSIVKVLRLC